MRVVNALLLFACGVSANIMDTKMYDEWYKEHIKPGYTVEITYEDGQACHCPVKKGCQIGDNIYLEGESIGPPTYFISLTCVNGTWDNLRFIGPYPGCNIGLDSITYIRNRAGATSHFASTAPLCLSLMQEGNGVDPPYAVYISYTSTTTGSDDWIYTIVNDGISYSYTRTEMVALVVNSVNRPQNTVVIAESSSLRAVLLTNGIYAVAYASSLSILVSYDSWTNRNITGLCGHINNGTFEYVSRDETNTLSISSGTMSDAILQSWSVDPAKCQYPSARSIKMENIDQVKLQEGIGGTFDPESNESGGTGSYTGNN